MVIQRTTVWIKVDNAGETPGIVERVPQRLTLFFFLCLLNVKEKTRPLGEHSYE